VTLAVGRDHIQDAMETGVSGVCDLYKGPVERMVKVNLSVDLTRRHQRSRLKNWRTDRL
jgi:hypothetical protein